MDLHKDIPCSFIENGRNKGKGKTQLFVIQSVMKFPARPRKGKTAIIPYIKNGKILWKMRVDAKILNNFIIYANKHLQRTPKSNK